MSLSTGQENHANLVSVDNKQPSVTETGRLVAAYRREERMSARELAERAGYGLTQSVIANLESGRKQDITVRQLLALAFVLGVPPVSLVFDLKFPYEEVEIARTPKNEPVQLASWLAARWFGGEELLNFEPHVGGDIAVVNTHFNERETIAYLLRRRSDLLFALEDLEKTYSRFMSNEIDILDDPLGKRLEDDIVKTQGEIYSVERSLKGWGVDLSKDPIQPIPKPDRF